jgi:hypothetical protein
VVPLRETVLEPSSFHRVLLLARGAVDILALCWTGVHRGSLFRGSLLGGHCEEHWFFREHRFD